MIILLSFVPISAWECNDGVEKFVLKNIGGAL